MKPSPPVSDYHKHLAALHDAVMKEYRAEEALRRRLDQDRPDLDLHAAYAAAVQKRQDAQKAMDEYRGES